MSQPWNADRSLPLRGLPGVYIRIEVQDQFGDGSESAVIRRELFRLLEAQLAAAGIVFLPSLEELTLTDGHPVLTVTGQYRQHSDIVFCSLAILHSESVVAARAPESEITAVTWHQFGQFASPATNFWPAFAEATRQLMEMFIADFQTATVDS